MQVTAASYQLKPKSSNSNDIHIQTKYNSTQLNKDQVSFTGKTNFSER